jgi:uncharacterized membrane protein YqgA involved in biofilm formation
MTQDLAHKRPFLLGSLIFGLSYPLTQYFAVPQLFAMAWKMAAVGFLIPYALRRHHNGDFAILAAFLGFCALGDGLIEIELLWGGISFAIAHVIAIWLYTRHWRKKAAFSQRLLAATLFICSPIIAFKLPGTEELGQQTALYAIFVAGMAAMAWSSQFPRYRVGLGAVLFVLSDMLIFARMGPLAGYSATNLIIWYLYYGGMLLIATGVVTTLIKRGHFSED